MEMDERFTHIAKDPRFKVTTSSGLKKIHITLFINNLILILIDYL